MSWPSTCESGEACNAALAAPSSTSQGSQFLSMHTQQHGGKRTRRLRMRGGAVSELASYPNSFEPSLIPENLHSGAGVAPLDKAIAELSQFRQAGGMRRTRHTRGGALGMGPAEHGGSLITPEMEQYTFQNPQWYDENLVNPAFVGPTSPKVGGRRKSYRKAQRKHRKANRKGSRKHRKTHRKNNRKGSRKSTRR
jgi:hypothetical protein